MAMDQTCAANAPTAMSLGKAFVRVCRAFLIRSSLTEFDLWLLPVSAFACVFLVAIRRQFAKFWFPSFPISSLQLLLFHSPTDLTNEKRDEYVTFTRYCLYFGLTVAACIMLQNSTTLASIVGLIVALYIGLSEYWIRNNPEPKAPSQKILEAAMGME